MEFTEIWLQGTACLVNAEHKQANKCFGIFNRHLIALNIEQMTIITGIPYINAATVTDREKAHSNGKAYLYICICLHRFRVKWLGIMLGRSSINL